MSRSKKLEFIAEEEIEVQGTCIPRYRGHGPSMDHAGGEPDEPECVEDLYVGVIIKGISIDVTEFISSRRSKSNISKKNAYKRRHTRTANRLNLITIIRV